MDALNHYRTIIKALANLAQMPEQQRKGQALLDRDAVMVEVQRIRAAVDALSSARPS